MSLALVTDLANLGAAGLMGGMWLWERRTSRQREEELTAAHGRIIRDEQRLAGLMQVVEHNSQALARLCETQHSIRQALAELREEIRRAEK